MLAIIVIAFLGIFAGNTNGTPLTDYALLFPNKGVVDLVNIWGMPSLAQFTVCLWMQSTDPKGTPFSYAVSGIDNELLIEYYGPGLKLNINNDGRHTSVNANDGKWRHICVSWENTAGSWKFYKDGALAEQGTGLKIGHVIQAGGSLMLAQEQELPGGGLVASQSLKGKLANVNLWDRVLDPVEISYFALDCLLGEGNVYKWSDFIPGFQGKPRVVVPSPCVPRAPK